jgi:hypothetical protein
MIKTNMASKNDIHEINALTINTFLLLSPCNPSSPIIFASKKSINVEDNIETKNKDNEVTAKNGKLGAVTLFLKKATDNTMEPVHRVAKCLNESKRSFTPSFLYSVKNTMTHFLVT